VKIIAGELKGRILQFPKTRIRPTMDKIRGAVFNIISANFPDILLMSRVCDIFAGTGAMGIEALSRGAQHATFIETDKTALKFLKDNIKGMEIKTEVIPYDARRAIDKISEKFDIIFLDPPYNMGLVQPIIDKLANFNILNMSGIIVIEHNKQEKFEISDNLVIYKQKSYNEKMITILAKKEYK
jgi:16S rRNA (guanine966-N2)-methyltransferase